MFRHFGSKELLGRGALAFFLVLGTVADGYGNFKNPPPGAVDLPGTTIVGQGVAVFTGDANNGTASIAISASCKGNSFILGPITITPMTLDAFRSSTDQAGLESTDLGRAAPPGCFSSQGGEFMRIAAVIRFSVQSARFVVADLILKGYE